MDAAAMLVTSHNTCVHLRQPTICLAEAFSIVGPALCKATLTLHAADDTSWLTPLCLHSLYGSHVKSGLTLAVGYDQLLQPSGWQPCLLKKPFQKLSR